MNNPRSERSRNKFAMESQFISNTKKPYPKVNRNIFLTEMNLAQHSGGIPGTKYLEEATTNSSGRKLPSAAFVES